MFDYDLSGKQLLVVLDEEFLPEVEALRQNPELHPIGFHPRA